MAGARTTYEKYATEISELLKDYGPDAGHYDALEIGRRLGFMRRLGQADQLAAAIRRHHSYPNFVGYIRADIATAGMEQEIDEGISIRDNVLGTRVVGQGWTNGAVDARLIPDADRAIFELIMHGTTLANSTGYNRSVRVRTSSTTQLNATKRVFFTAQGISSEAASASATTSSRYTGLSARGPLVEKIAWKKAYQQKGAAQQEASRLARRRLRRKVDSQAAEQLTKANDSYLDKYRNPLVRREAFPAEFDVHTDASAVRIKMLQATDDELAAPVPPGEPPADADIAVRLHESMVNNLATARLGGLTVLSEDTPQDIVDKLRAMKADLQFAKSSEGLDKFQNDRLEKVRARRKAEGRPLPPEKPPKQDWFAITFTQRDPISVEFRDGKLKLTIRGARFLGPQQVDPKSSSRMSIWAEYNVKTDKYGGLQFDLQNWDVTPTNVERGGRLRISDQAVVSKLRARFRSIFEGENGENKIVEVFPLELPGNWKKVGELNYTVAELDSGWLNIALNRKVEPDDKQAARPTEPLAAQRRRQGKPASTDAVKPDDVDLALQIEDR